jgi:hypothetical protein
VRMRERSARKMPPTRFPPNVHTASGLGCSETKIQFEVKFKGDKD